MAVDMVNAPRYKRAARSPVRLFWRNHLAISVPTKIPGKFEGWPVGSHHFGAGCAQREHQIGAVGRQEGVGRAGVGLGVTPKATRKKRGRSWSYSKGHPEEAESVLELLQRLSGRCGVGLGV